MFLEKIRYLIKYYTSFWFYLVVLVSFTLALLFPRALSSLVPQQRFTTWSNFENKIVSQKKINAQDYWKFREFYNVGNFRFMENGFDSKTTDELLLKMSVSTELGSLKLPFLIYDSPKFRSLDSIVSTSTLENIINTRSVQLVTKYKEDNLLIIKNNNIYLLMFILPVDEMKKVNSYFDYNKSDIEKKLAGKYWLNISEIKVN